MNKVLKWILYILLGLVVLAVVGGFLAMIFGGFGYGMMRPGVRLMEPGIRMMEPFYYHRTGGFLFAGLLCLGVILLVIVGIVALVYALVNKNKNAQVTAPAPITSPVETTSQPAEMTAPIRSCSNCGKPSQEEWKTCPYCGNPLE
jgi:hypothetical protein